MELQLDFLTQLVWKIVDNTLDEDTKAGRVDGRRPRARRGALGDHEILTSPKYC